MLTWESSRRRETSKLFNLSRVNFNLVCSNLSLPSIYSTRLIHSTASAVAGILSWWLLCRRCCLSCNLDKDRATNKIAWNALDFLLILISSKRRLCQWSKIDSFNSSLETRHDYTIWNVLQLKIQTLSLSRLAVLCGGVNSTYKIVSSASVSLVSKVSRAAQPTQTLHGSERCGRNVKKKEKKRLSNHFLQ